MKTKSLLLLVVVSLLSLIATAQNVNYQVRVVELYRSGYGDCLTCGDPDPKWSAKAYDNVNGSVSSSSCFERTSSATTWNITDEVYRTQNNTSATTINLGMDAWENDVTEDFPCYGSDCGFDGSCIGFADFRRQNNNNITQISFRTAAPCSWTGYTYWQGDFGIKVEIYWEWADAPTLTLVGATDRELCIGNTTSLQVNVNSGNGHTLGRAFQWQVSTNTSGTGGNWANIPGASGTNITSTTYSPPQISGTRLYRVVVSSDCSNTITSPSSNSGSFRVTYNPMNGTTNAPVNFPSPHRLGDNPPAVQSSTVCGGTILPGSVHTLNTLQPSAIGAVDGVGYSWAASGGSLNSTSASSVTYTAPSTPGNYAITLTYTSGCGNTNTVCNFTVGSPDCDFVYVASNGVDLAGRGGPTNPFATLTYALSNLGTRKHIRIANGSYTTDRRINIPANVIIEGRYDNSNPSNWKKVSNGATSITINASTSGTGPSVTEANASSRHLIGFSSNGTSGWTLQDLNITTGSVSGTSSGGRGSSNYALWVKGASNYNVIRCALVAGAASNGTAGSTTAGSGGAGGAGAGGNGGGGSSGGGTPGAGVKGGNGNGGAVGGNGGSSTGSSSSSCFACACGCNRQGNGQSGANGASAAAAATSYSAGDRPSVSLVDGDYFVPGGQASSGSNGFGGAGGGGGQGARGGRLSCGDCSGSSGGRGGDGGNGGLGGTGGYGGGGSFAIWTNNSTTGVNIINTTATTGTVGIGGNGASGQAGTSGSGGSGGGGSGVCALSACTAVPGSGGSGGNGSAGGRGRDGANGLAAAYVADGVNTSISGSIATTPVTEVRYLSGKACKNSEIELNKASGTWVLPSGLSLVNDRASGQTSYALSNGTIKVATSTSGATYSLSSPLVFNSFLRIASDDRPQQAITRTPANGNICVGSGSLISFEGVEWGTEVDYNWVIFTSDANNPVGGLVSNEKTPTFDVSGLGVGTYNVRYRVREICCGWSVPVYTTFTIVEDPTAPNNLAKSPNVTTLCVNTSGLSVANATGGTGGAGNCNYYYSYQNTTGGWSAWSTTKPTIVAGATPGFVRIKAKRICDGAGCDESPETAEVIWEVVDIPDAPTSSGASTVSVVSFTASWDNTPAATSYELDVATDAGFSNLVVNNENVGLVTVYEVTGLQPGTTYYYRVRALNGSCQGAYSATQQLTTTSGVEWKSNTIANFNDWNNPQNWEPPVVPNGCGFNVTIPFIANQPSIGSTTFAVGNLSMAEGSFILLNNLNSRLEICGDVAAGGSTGSSFTGLGKAILKGNTPQLISGVLNADVLRLDNSQGVGFTSGGTANVSGILELKAGVFTTNGGTLRFTSQDVFSCGIIDNFSSGFVGTINGNIIAERAYDAATDTRLHNQHFFGSPINQPAITQLAPAMGSNNVPVTPKPDCDEVFTASGSNYGNVFEWEEDLVSTCYLEGWVVRSNGVAQNARGYSVVKSGPGKLSLTGTANLGSSYSVSNLSNTGWLSYSKQNNLYIGGWALVSNPYLAPVDLNAAANPDFDNNVMILNTHGLFAGTFQPLSMSGTGLIAPFQGFMVRKSTDVSSSGYSTATFTVNGSDRRVGVAEFHKNTDHQMSLMVLGNGYADITYLNFLPNASEAYDSQFDGLKASSNQGQPTLFSYILGNWASVNSNKDVQSTPTVRVGFKPGAEGTFIFQGDGFADLPNTTVFLEDLKEQIMHNLTDVPDYTFSASVADNTDRFLLHFFFNSPSAVGSNGGEVLFKMYPNPTSGLLNIESSVKEPVRVSIIDINGKVVLQTILEGSSQLDISALAASVYQVHLVGESAYTVKRLVKE